jgi:hypothetical protein
VPIHDIDMNDAAAAALRRSNFIGKMGKIRRKYGWK